MGGSQTKSHHANGCELRILREKTKLLQEKLDEMMYLRETESQVYEQELMVHALKESKWKQDRKWLQRELKKALEERNNGKQTDFAFEQMREERAQPDEAVEKWKRLYLAIKIELDNLINNTHQAGEAASWRGRVPGIRGTERAKSQRRDYRAFAGPHSFNRARRIQKGARAGHTAPELAYHEPQEEAKAYLQGILKKFATLKSNSSMINNIPDTFQNMEINPQDEINSIMIPSLEEAGN